MSNDKFELHPELKDASLEKVCEMADYLYMMLDNGDPAQRAPRGKAHDLSYMLEYIRLTFDLVPKK